MGRRARGTRRQSRPGPRVLGAPHARGLAQTGSPPDCEATAADKPWRFPGCTGTGTGRDYFLSNPRSEAPVDGIVALRARARQRAACSIRWTVHADLPEKTVASGWPHARAAAFRAAAGVLRDSGAWCRPQGVQRRNFPALEPVMTVEGPWHVSFNAHGSSRCPLRSTRTRTKCRWYSNN